MVVEDTGEWSGEGALSAREANGPLGALGMRRLLVLQITRELNGAPTANIAAMESLLFAKEEVRRKEERRRTKREVPSSAIGNVRLVLLRLSLDKPEKI